MLGRIVARSHAIAVKAATTASAAAIHIRCRYASTTATDAKADADARPDANPSAVTRRARRPPSSRLRGLGAGWRALPARMWKRPGAAKQELRRLLSYHEVGVDERAADPAFCVDHVDPSGLRGEEFAMRLSRVQLDTPDTNGGRVLARWAANAPDSLAFRAVGAGFGLYNWFR
jgi:hypothetical protein